MWIATNSAIKNLSASTKQGSQLFFSDMLVNVRNIYCPSDAIFPLSSKRPSTEPSSALVEAISSPPIIREVVIGEILFGSWEIADQEAAVLLEMKKALMLMMVIESLGVIGRDKLLSQRVQLREHIDQILHGEFRFRLRIRFRIQLLVSNRCLIGNLSNRSHRESQPEKPTSALLISFTSSPLFLFFSFLYNE